MSKIHVCPFSHLEPTLQHSKARWMVSLSGPGKSLQRPQQISKEFLALEFNDIDGPCKGLLPPSAEQIKMLLDFLGSWDWQDDLVIHCWMGISRSTAAAAIALAQNTPPQDMNKLAQKLRSASPMATPNSLMVSIADNMLRLNGSFVAAIRSIGRGADARQGEPFMLERLS